MALRRGQTVRAVDFPSVEIEGMAELSSCNATKVTYKNGILSQAWTLLSRDHECAVDRNDNNLDNTGQ